MQKCCRKKHFELKKQSTFPEPVEEMLTPSRIFTGSVRRREQGQDLGGDGQGDGDLQPRVRLHSVGGPKNQELCLTTFSTRIIIFGLFEILVSMIPQRIFLLERK